jgi:acyl-coenzyme A synthetase/AMP-(fatty) acid ligase
MLAGGRDSLLPTRSCSTRRRFSRARSGSGDGARSRRRILGASRSLRGRSTAADDLQILIVTGEIVNPSLVERWFRLFPSIPMANAYGPTEASDDVTQVVMREPPATPTVPIGRPLRNFHIYIVDDALRLCPIGVAGELCVSGAGVGRGYLHDPARTAAAFLEDPFRPERGVRMYRTGDIGWFTTDGMLLLSGRKDHQVKVRGYRIELGDIEAALTTLAAVRDAVVVDRRDRAADGAYLAAYVSLRDETMTGEQILEQLAARLPEYMIPATCTALAELPLTPNGKIDRAALPRPTAPLVPLVRRCQPCTTAEDVLCRDLARCAGRGAAGYSRQPRSAAIRSEHADRPRAAPKGSS